MSLLRTPRAGILGTLCLIIVAHLAASVYWIQVNVTPYGRDAGGHLTRAVQHAEILRDVTWQTLFQAVTFHGFRPPALYLAAQIPYRLFGWSIDSALLTNVFFLGVTLVFTYLLAKRFMGGRDGIFPLLAVVITAFLPMLAAMARTFYLDGFLTAMLLIILYSMLESDNFTRKRWVLVWGVSIGIGMLVKWSLPAHLFLPVLYYAWRADLLPAQLTALRQLRIQWRPLLLALAAAIGLSTLWYLPNRDYALTLPLGDGLWLFWAAWLLPTFYLLLLPTTPPEATPHSRRQNALRNFWMAFFVAVAVASVWYVARIDFFTELSDTAFGDYDGRFDSENTQYDVLNVRNLTRYPEYVVTRQLGWLCGLLILPLAGWLWLRRGRGWHTARVDSWILWLCLLSTYLLLLLTPRETSARNLVPLLPLFGLLFADALRDLPRRWQMAVGGVWVVVLALHWSVYTFDALDSFWNQTKGAWAESEFLLRPNSGSTAAGYWIAPEVLDIVSTSHDSNVQPQTILGMLINSPEIHRGPYNYLIRTDYPDVDLIALTERFPDMWVRTIRSEWVLSKDGDNHDLDEPGLRVVDEVYSEPNGLFPLLYTPQHVYPLPNGETATLWRRTIGQPYLPEPKEELQPLGEALRNWMSEETPLMLSEAEQGVDLGLLDLTPHHVSVMEQGIPEAETLFVLLHRGEPTDADVWAQLPQDYFMAWDGWFGSEYLSIWSTPLPDDQTTVYTPTLTFGNSELVTVRSVERVAAGDIVPLTPTWNVGSTPLKASYRLLDGAGTVLFQIDRDIVAESTFGLVLPSTTAAGVYTVAVTVYDPAIGTPIPSANGDTLVSFMQVQVE